VQRAERDWTALDDSEVDSGLRLWERMGEKGDLIPKVRGWSLGDEGSRQTQGIPSFISPNRTVLNFMSEETNTKV
jgi:hypothetical protein